MKKTISPFKKAKRFFALLILSVALLLPNFIKAQTTCPSAILISPNTSCTLKDYVFSKSDTATWFTFIADSQAVFIDIGDPVLPADTPAAHVHTLELYGGNCSSLTLLAARDINSGLPAYLPTSGLKIDYSGLTIGFTYYIRVTRNTPAQCAQSICTSSTAYFSMCVQNQSAVVIPWCVWPGTYNCGELIGNGGFEYLDPNWNGTGCVDTITINGTGNTLPACEWEPMPLPGNIDATPDFFNPCANPTCVGSPANGFGYQAPHSGNGYAGLLGWATLVGPPPDIGFEGIMQYFPASPLIAGKVYFEEMYVSLADISNMATTIGFTSFPPVGPHDYYHPTNISDTANWTRVSHCFTAIGGETERVITSNGNTLIPDTTLVGATGYTFSIPNQNDHVAYFFIDDVTLRPLAYAGQDVTQCAFNTTIGCTALPAIIGATYSWAGSGPGGITIATPSSPSTNVSVTAAGTYTFIITATFGSCSDSDTMTFTVTGFTSVINTSSSAICLGGSVNLSVTNTPATGPFTYAWGPPASGLSSTTINNPVATPTATTTYVVLVHNTTTDCYSLASTTIIVSSPSVTIVSPLTDNTCGTSVYSANITGAVSPFTYLWSTSANGTISGSSTVNPVTVNWNAVGAGSVTVTITDSVGCSASDTITVSTCCVPDTGLVISNDSASVLFGPNDTLMFFRQFNINGTFVVDINLGLFVSTLNMGPNAKIIVTGGHTLNLDKTIIRAGCCEMWNAIEIENLSDTLLMTGCYMGDAIRGIVSNGGAIYKLSQDNVFNRNLVSITVNPYSGNHGGTVSATTFTSVDSAYCPTLNGTLLPPYSMQFPLYGILVTSVDSITIGDVFSIVNANIFTFLRNGIRTKNTNVKIYNNQFIQVNRSGNNSKAIWCAGRFPTLVPFNFTQYTVNVGGPSLLLAQKNYFTSCPNGVFTDTAMSTIVTNNKFDYNYPPSQSSLNGVAVNIQHCTGLFRVIDVNGDSINNYGTGVLCYFNQKCKTRIRNNMITRTQIGAFNFTGIACASNGANLDTVIIASNTIRNAKYGVRLSSTNHTIVRDNLIYLRLTSNSLQPNRGISLENCHKNSVRNNDIYKENPLVATTNLWTGGIYLANSDSCQINCNSVFRMGYGIRGEGAGTVNGTFFNNYMNQDFKGIWLSNGAVLGQQGSPTVASDNRWTGSVTYDRLYTSIATLGYLSNFYYRPIGAAFNPNPVNDDGTGFLIFITPTTTMIPPTTNCNYVQQSNSGSPSQMIAQGQIQYTGNQDAGTWLSRQGLYSILLDDSTYTASDPILTNFKDSADQHNIGTFDRAMKVYSRGSLSSPGAMVAAYYGINNLTPANAVEVHLQVVEHILLRHRIHGGGFTLSELDTLRAIAQLCPFTDGNAVYMARGILLPLDTTDYENVCESGVGNSNRIANPNVEQTYPLTFRLYPNPNNGEIKLEYSLHEGENGQVNIYATTGQLVKTIYLIPDLNQMNVSLSELEEGLYLYDIKINGELKQADRIIIIR